MTAPAARGRLDAEPADLYIEGQLTRGDTPTGHVPVIVIPIHTPDSRSAVLGRIALGLDEARQFAGQLTSACDALALADVEDTPPKRVYHGHDAIPAARPEHAPLPFPLPNTTIEGNTVVASVSYIDDERGVIALVLVLEHSAPFFSVGFFALTDVADGSRLSDGLRRGEFQDFGRFENIVEAVRAYEQNGGDI